MFRFTATEEARMLALETFADSAEGEALAEFDAREAGMLVTERDLPLADADDADVTEADWEAFREATFSEFPRF